MLSRLLSRGISPFSRLFYQPAMLDYPISLNDQTLLGNKAMMDEVNSKYSAILKKVLLILFRLLSKLTKKF
jgi:hypothetical protein